MRGTPLERFEAKYTVQPNGCWQWTAHLSPKGYPRFRVGRKIVRAHRFAYETHRGPIPDDKVIDHLCRNRGCVNPDHMEVTTNRENCCRGEHPHIIAWRENRCTRGHPFDDQNTQWKKRKDGRLERRCAECSRQYQRARRQAERQAAA
jgi:hypothetical protein